MQGAVETGGRACLVIGLWWGTLCHPTTESVERMVAMPGMNGPAVKLGAEYGAKHQQVLCIQDRLAIPSGLSARQPPTLS